MNAIPSTPIDRRYTVLRISVITICAAVVLWLGLSAASDYLAIFGKHSTESDSRQRWKREAGPAALVACTNAVPGIISIISVSTYTEPNLTSQWLATVVLDQVNQLGGISRRTCEVTYFPASTGETLRAVVRNTR